MKIKKILWGLLIFSGVTSLIGAAGAFMLPLPGTVSVLMYHYLGSEQDARAVKNYVSEKSFMRQMGFLKRFGYRVISLDEYNRIRKGKEKSRGREIVLTFDDGHYSFETKALPILDRYRFPVTLFLISEHVKGEIGGSMSENILRKILTRKWVAIGSHSKTHPFLSKIDKTKIEDELRGSKADLERMFGTPVLYLAYPYGDFDRRSTEIAQQAGYELAFTTSPKKFKEVPEGDYSLSRVKITRSSDNLFVFWAKLSGLYQAFKRGRLEKDEV